MNGFSKYKRVTKYIEGLEKQKHIKNKEEIQKLNKKLRFVGYKLRTLEIIRTISFILVYSTITSGILSIIPGFETFSQNIIKISSLVGTTIFLIIIALTSKTISIYTIDLTLISSHIISIYNKK